MEKKVLTAKMVAEIGLQKYYVLSHRIQKGIYWGREVDIEKSVTDTEFKKEYKFLSEAAVGGVNVVCISDAHTHIERIVFAGFMYKKNGEVQYSRYRTAIDGKNTFMRDGGDYSAVYEPGVYLRHLARLNGFTFGGIL